MNVEPKVSPIPEIKNAEEKDKEKDPKLKASKKLSTDPTDKQSTKKVGEVLGSVVRKEEKALVDSLNFKEFNIIEFCKKNKCKNFAGVMAAIRRSGKSLMLRDLCYQMHKEEWYSDVYVFSLTAHLQHDLFDYVPKENIFMGMNEGKLREIWTKQEHMIEKLEKQGIKKEDMPMVLVLLDDIIGDANAVKYSEMLINFAVAGRHLNVAFCILVQHFNALPNKLRDNVDWFVCFNTKKKDNRINIIESYMDASNHVGEGILRKITSDTNNPYQCMVIDNICRDPNPEEYIYKYTAKESVPKFKMGSKNKRNFISPNYFDDNRGKPGNYRSIKSDVRTTITRRN